MKWTIAVKHDEDGRIKGGRLSAVYYETAFDTSTKILHEELAWMSSFKLNLGDISSSRTRITIVVNPELPTDQWTCQPNKHDGSPEKANRL